MSVIPLPVTHEKTSEVAHLLNGLISKNRLQPGDRLPSIRELATTFGVKIGAVRDALLDAQGRGIVKILPRAGAFVQSVDESSPFSSMSERTSAPLQENLGDSNRNLFHMLDAREIIELETVTRAAQKSELEDFFGLRQILEEMAEIPTDQRCTNFVRLDIRFHLEIARLSGNTVLVSMLDSIMKQLESQLLRVSWSTERRRRTDESHSLIYLALVQRDVESARNEMQAHSQDAYNSLLDKIRQPPAMKNLTENE